MKMTITGVPPYDGEYDLGESFDEFRNRDWRTMKRIAGVGPVTLEQALRDYDPTAITAIAIVALERSGRYPRIDEEVIWDATTVQSFTLDLRDAAEIAAADHPAEPADPNARSEPDEPTTRSGSPSPNGTANPEDTPNRTGLPSWDTPASDLETSPT